MNTDTERLDFLERKSHKSQILFYRNKKAWIEDQTHPPIIIARNGQTIREAIDDRIAGKPFDPQPPV